MIRMFMADEDTVNFFGARAAESFKAPQHFFFTQAGVNEKSRAPRLKQGAIARTARRQNGYAKRDTLPPRRASAIACTRHCNGMMAKCWAGVNTKSRKRNYALRYSLEFVPFKDSENQMASWFWVSSKPLRLPTTEAAMRPGWKNSRASCWTSSTVTLSSSAIKSCAVKWRLKYM